MDILCEACRHPQYMHEDDAACDPQYIDTLMEACECDRFVSSAEFFGE